MKSRHRTPIQAERRPTERIVREPRRPPLPVRGQLAYCECDEPRDVFSDGVCWTCRSPIEDGDGDDE